MAWPWGCSSPTTCGHDPWKCEEDLQEDQQWFLILVSTQINSISKCRLCQRLWFRTLLRSEKCQKNTPQSTADISNHKFKSFPQILFHVTWSSNKDVISKLVALMTLQRWTDKKQNNVLLASRFILY